MIIQTYWYKCLAQLFSMKPNFLLKTKVFHAIHQRNFRYILSLSLPTANFWWLLFHCKNIFENIFRRLQMKQRKSVFYSFWVRYPKKVYNDAVWKTFRSGHIIEQPCKPPDGIRFPHPKNVLTNLVFDIWWLTTKCLLILQ